MSRDSLRSFEVPPSAARLTTSLRDIGYDFTTAVADLVDNSVSAGATRVNIEIVFDGSASYVLIADDGSGMTERTLNEALRFGSRSDYSQNDLGRYGLGLKTASLSQCRKVTVVARRSQVNRRITIRTLDLDFVEESDSWLIVEPEGSHILKIATDKLAKSRGTVVIWEKLDRILPFKQVDGGWARRRLHNYTSRAAEHLGMVFHRYLEGTVRGRDRLEINVNGAPVQSWNPFAPNEPLTRVMPLQSFEIRIGDVVGEVLFQPYVLPSRSDFSSTSEFERMSGPLKWNRQQGIYAYRADRLVQWGGWNGIRGIDEHTKLARASLSFDTRLDEAFHIDVAKMRISVPTELKQMLDRPIHELCVEAEASYRDSGQQESKDGAIGGPGVRSSRIASSYGLAISTAAMELGYSNELREIVALLRQRDPDVVVGLGLD